MKLMLAFLFATVLPLAAFAQTPTYTLTLSGDDVVLIGKVLRDRPWSEVNLLLNRIQAQLDQQNAKAAALAKDEAAKGQPKTEDAPKGN